MRERKCTSVLEILCNTKVTERGAKSDLLLELIAYVASSVDLLERQQLSEAELYSFQAALTLLAKAIKQDPLQYNKLNNTYM